MRFRLLRRRLTISAPRMSVRSAMPWPLRWVVAAIVLGFCAAIALWAFEFGKDIAGLDRGSRQDMVKLHAEIASLRTELAKAQQEHDQAQSIANTAGALVTAGQASEGKLLEQIKLLQLENQSLHDDLGFFKNLIPSNGVGGVAIRGLKADILNGKDLKWQVLVMQADKHAAEFNGRLELTVSGFLNAKPWTSNLPGGGQSLTIKQYGRLEGIFEIPPQVVVKSVLVKVLEGNTVRATQSLKL
jgi:hypothetical protein